MSLEIVRGRSTSINSRRLGHAHRSLALESVNVQMSKMSGFVEDGSSGVSSAGASSPSSVARLVIVFGELSDDSRTEVFLRTRLVEGLLRRRCLFLKLFSVRRKIRNGGYSSIVAHLVEA